MNYLKLKQSSSSKWSANEDNRNPLCALNELVATHLSEYTGDWKYLWRYQLILLTLKHTWPLLWWGEIWENQCACWKLPFSQWQERLFVNILTFPFLLKTLRPMYIVSQRSPGRVYFAQNTILIYTCCQLTWFLSIATTLNFLENMSHKSLHSHLCFLLIFFFIRGKS